MGVADPIMITMVRSVAVIAIFFVFILIQRRSAPPFYGLKACLSIFSSAFAVILLKWHLRRGSSRFYKDLFVSPAPPLAQPRQ